MAIISVKFVVASNSLTISAIRMCYPFVFMGKVVLSD